MQCSLQPAGCSSLIFAAMRRRSGGIALKKAMERTALLLALARTSSLVPEGGILRGRVHVVLEGDATPPPGDAVQVVLGTSETAAGGWGDGAHPSTALCLEWLSERGFKEDESFLDYGCGSGVLAIAARKLGCPTAVGVDVEYEALESAAENAERNGIVDGVDWVHGRSVVPGMDEYDAVVANILVGQLSRPSMVATLALGTKIGGALCLSGVRPDQCAVLERLYAYAVAMSPRRPFATRTILERVPGLLGPAYIGPDKGRTPIRRAPGGSATDAAIM